MPLRCSSGGEVLGKAAAAAQAQVAHAVTGHIRAAVAGGTQEQPAAQAETELGFHQRGVIGAAAFKLHAEAAVLFPVQLGAEADGQRLFLLDIGHGAHQLLPHAGGGDAAAEDVHRQQLFGVLAQIAVQAVHLTGRAGEEDAAVALQAQAHQPVAVAEIALHRLGAAEAVDVGLGGDGRVAHAETVVRGGAEHHAAVIENELGQQGEDTAGAGETARLLVAVPGGESGGLRPRLALLQNGADMAAVAALDAGVGDGGVAKAFPVGQQMDGALGAAAGAGTAAGAAVMGGQTGQSVFRHGGASFSGGFALIIPPRRGDGKAEECSSLVHQILRLYSASGGIMADVERK